MNIIAKSDLGQKCIITVILILIGLVQMTFAQTISQTQNKADQVLRSTGRVNPSTLGMEISIPLGGFVGRAGNDKPLTLEYSSKVWSTWEPDVWYTLQGSTVTDLRPLFSKGSVRGWTTSLQIPRIEISDDLYGDEGRLMLPDGNGLKYVKRLRVFMPDGTAHEMRQDDNLYCCPYNNEGLDFTGTYLSVDGSKMRLEVGSSQSVLYFPDGDRFIFDSNRIASTYIDRHGNKIIYNKNTNQWTDTLGRVLTNPLPAGQGELDTFQPTEGTQVYQFPGLNGQNQQVEFTWAKLSTQQSSLAYMTNRFCLTFQNKNLPSGSTFLFTISGLPTNACDPYTTPFDPIVLTDVRLQNGASYKFHYNLYAEIDKIEYPTGGYERFEYGTITPIQSAGDQGYDQFNRGVKKRWISSDGTTASEVLWQYDITRVNQELPTDYYKIRTTAPDNSYTEQFLFDWDSDFHSPYGFGNIGIGQPYEERVYSTTGQLLSRKLTKYTKTGAMTGGYSEATRDLRPEKEISIIFDPGNSYTLAQKSETFYDTDGNSDPAYFSSLNPEQTKTYHYVVISTSDAQPTTLVADAEFNRIANYLSSAQVANIIEIDYLYNSNYKARNIAGLATEIRVKDASNNVKAKSQISYDETSYLEAASITNATGWENPQTVVRGLATTTRRWHDITNNFYIENHVLYDQFGNIRKTWDGRGNYSEIQYADNYTDSVNRNTYSLPTTTISYSGANNTGTQFITSIKYDFNTGLSTSTTDANNLETRIEYNDALLRPTKVSTYFNNQQVGAETITQYGAPDTNGQLPSTQRFVKVKTQIDAEKWKEGYTWFDGLARTVKTQSVDLNGDVFNLTCYDLMGRVSKVSNPFRNVSNPTCSSSLEWTTTTYNAAGRVWKVTAPDNAVVETNYLLATAGNNIGAAVTIKDQAMKERRSITNALGHLTRVDEPDINNSNQLGGVDSPNQPTYYEYDTLSNLTKVKQGGTFSQPQQLREFVYDNLSRLKSATNPESGLIQYQYDNNGNLTQKSDARSITTSYTYDALNRVTFRDYSDSTPDVTYTYDNITSAKGKLSKVVTGSVSSPFSVTEYTEFDILGRVKKSKQTTDGTAYPEMEYTYNLFGALIEQKYPSGRVVKNVLDNNGDLAIVQSKKNANYGFWNYAKHFTYTVAGAVSSTQLGNGRWESTVFNSRLQPTQIALGTVQNGTDKLKLNFTYNTSGQSDNNGNVLSQIITVPSETRDNQTFAAFTATQIYSYDSLNRIKQATETIAGQTGDNWRQTFNYDRYGNRNFDEANTTTLPKNCLDKNDQPAVCWYDNPSASEANNRLNDFQFDNTGNTTRDGQNRKFTYDGENKQIKVETVDAGGNPTGTIGEYFYDGDGKRVKKIVPSTGETTIFIYNAGGNLVAEYSTQVTSQQGAKVSYLTTDHLGSPRINTDQNGLVTARQDYQPFGEEIQRASYGADTVRKQFTSYERDNEVDLDFAQARYYNFKQGRFTTVDDFPGVKINPQTFNRYIYVINNPHKFNDPSGNYQMLPHKGENYKETKKEDSWFDNMPFIFLVIGKDKPFDSTKDKPVKDKKGSETLFFDYDPVTGIVTFTKKAKKAYNCHAYAWFNKKGDPNPNQQLDITDGNGTRLIIPGWDNDVTNNLSGYDQLDSDAPNKKGDKVLYYVDENGDGKYNDGEETLHSAKVVKVDKDGNTTEVKSKRGQLGISTNHPNAPGFYDEATSGRNQGKPTSRAYFRKKK